MFIPKDRVRPFVCGVFAAALGSLTAAADDEIRFNESIRPILTTHCTKCHGGVKQAGGVSFIYREKALGEGDSGNPIIVPGDLEKSELVYRITTDDEDDRMPPVDESPHGLSAEEIEALKKWVEQGAKWEDHWAFGKPVKPTQPEVENTGWVREPIDRFVLQGIEERGWKPNREARPEDWLRRATLDITGLPPTIEEVDAFLEDAATTGDAAYEKAVERLLASPAYGERWASMWLDQMRYADSRGLGQDGRRSIWKYRDWVIDAFNADLPYNEFTVKQLAGDLLPDPTMEDLIATAGHRNTQASNEGGTDDEEFRVEAVVDRVNTTWQVWQATTIGCTQCHSHPYDPISHDDYFRFMAFFNNSVDCDTPGDEPNLRVPLDPADYSKARELDKKIADLETRLWKAGDSLRQSDRWSPVTMTSIQSNNSTRYRFVDEDGKQDFVLVGGPEQNTKLEIEADIPSGTETITAVKVTIKPRDLEKALKDSEWGFVISRMKIETIEETPRELEFSHAIADEPEPMRDPFESTKDSRWGFTAYTRINHPREAVFILKKPMQVGDAKRLAISLEQNVTELGAFPLIAKRGNFAVSSSPEWTNHADSGRLHALREELDSTKKERREIRTVNTPIMAERPAHLARPTHVFVRGNFLEKDKRVDAGLPTELAGDVNVSDRLAMAQWFASTENPLTARVAVNRVWAQLFGRGIVATLEDFGSSGELPSHPELLDDLAIRFQTDMGWSAKRLISEIVLSATYRQSAEATPAMIERDAANQWLARGPRVRLSAEMVRDQSLAISGLLSKKMHGPPVHPPIPEGVWQPFSRDDWKTPEDEDRYRRSVYTYTKRSIPYPTFATFDAPSREFCAPRRLRSNTPLQALVTLNDEAFVECANAFAVAINEASSDLEDRLAWGYRRATSRRADAQTIAALRGLHAEALGQYRRDETTENPEQAAMQIVASVLLNLDEIMVR